jgi:hypothetical protein
MNRPLCQAFALAGLLTGVVRPAHAQFEGLLSSINDVSLSATWARGVGGFAEPSAWNHPMFGFEMIWHLAEVPRKGAVTKIPKTVNTGTTQTITRRSGHAGADTVTTETNAFVENADTTKSLIFELALGYSEFASLRSRDPSFELRGTARELPALTVYVSAWEKGRRFMPYFGLRSGFIEIQGLQAFDSIANARTRVYSAAPRAFQFGGVIGISDEKGPEVFEFACAKRSFRSLVWSPASTGDIPTRFPRELSFSGCSFKVGIQIRAREKKP